MATTFPATILDASTTPGELVIEYTNGGTLYIRATVTDDMQDTAEAIPALTEALHAECLTWAEGQEPTDIAGPVQLTSL